MRKPRLVGALVAGALAIGLIAGASLAPPPPSSLASGSTIVTRLLALLAAEGSTRPAPPTVPALASAVTPRPARAGAPKTHLAAKEVASPPATTSPNAPSEGAAGQGATGEGGAGGGRAGGGKPSSDELKPVRLPPISHVWLVVLTGPGLSQAAVDPSGYPYLTGQLLKAGTQLERYSAIEAYELAGDAALLTGGVGESVSTISQPCSVAAGTSANGLSSAGSAGGPCPSGAAGGQSEADAFLQRAIAPILASTLYRERGALVITFGSAAQETGLSETTLASSPATGALLLSPSLKAGGHSSEAFDSLAPRQSLEAIFAAS